MVKDRNLDRDPGFLLMVAFLLPLMVAVEIAVRVHDARVALVSRFRAR